MNTLTVEQRKAYEKVERERATSYVTLMVANTRPLYNYCKTMALQMAAGMQPYCGAARRLDNAMRSGACHMGIEDKDTRKAFLKHLRGARLNRREFSEFILDLILDDLAYMPVLERNKILRPISTPYKSEFLDAWRKKAIEWCEKTDSLACKNTEVAQECQ